jgi:ribonuclease D
MWQRRDELARKRDITAGRVLPDAAIVEAAVAAPRSRSELAELPAFRTRGAQRHLRDFWSALNEAARLPDAQLPPVAGPSDGPPAARMWSSRFPEAAVRLTACREAVASVAAAVDVPPENVVPPDAVRRLAWEPPDPVDQATVAAALAAAGARAWQVGLTAEPLAGALSAP